jgi:hypothetical protein
MCRHRTLYVLAHTTLPLTYLLNSKMARQKQNKSSPKKPLPAKKKAASAKQAPPAAATKKATPKTPPSQSLVSNVASRKQASTQQPSPGNSTTRAQVKSVIVPNAAPTNEGSTHGDSTLGGGRTATGQPASIAYTSLLTRNNDTLASKQVIRDFVTHHFFKYVKFITSWKKLAYHDPATNPNNYCAVVTRGCHLPPGTDTVSWWETVAKHEVRNKFTHLRSDRITVLKGEYTTVSADDLDLAFEMRANLYSIQPILGPSPSWVTRWMIGQR